MAYVEREKSKMFKEKMHAAEFDPESRERWAELRSLVEEAKKVVPKNRLNRVRFYKLLMNLGWHIGEHRLVWRDMRKAFCTVAMFFPDFGTDDVAEITAWKQAVRQAPLLFDNAAKADRLPYTRRIESNATMPQKFWDESYKVTHGLCGDCPKIHRKPPPYDWDKLIRLLVIKLFKAGIVGPGYNPYPEGQPFIASTSGALSEDDAELVLKTWGAGRAQRQPEGTGSKGTGVVTAGTSNGAAHGNAASTIDLSPRQSRSQLLHRLP